MAERVCVVTRAQKHLNTAHFGPLNKLRTRNYTASCDWMERDRVTRVRSLRGTVKARFILSLLRSVKHHDSSNLLAESQVLLFSLEEACAGLAATLQLLHGLQQRLVLHLQLQEAAGGQLIDLVAQRLLRNCREEKTSTTTTTTSIKNRRV